MTDTSSTSKKRRIMYNYDGGTAIYFPHRYPMTLDQYYDCVDQLLRDPGGRVCALRRGDNSS
jgi:hypothetical protein